MKTKRKKRKKRKNEDKDISKEQINNSITNSQKSETQNKNNS
jgi:hypothetical protein